MNKYLAFVILIGGKSTRFGNDKGMFEFLGKPLISYQIETLSQFKNAIFIVANSKKQVQEYVNKIDITKIVAFIIDERDILSDKSIYSPLIGLYSAFQELEKLGYKKAFAISCDNPFIKKEVIEYLIKHSKKFDCSMPKWNNGFIEPLFAIYPIRKGLLKTKDNITKGTYKMINLLDDSWKINYIPIEDSLQALDKRMVSFINVNEPKDLQKLEKYNN